MDFSLPFFNGLPDKIVKFLNIDHLWPGATGKISVDKLL